MTVRVLAALLLVEAATASVLTALALVAAAITWFRRSSGDWSDLALAVLGLLALVGGVLAVIDVSGWVALRRRRRRAATVLSLLAHLVPVLALSWMVGRDISGRTGTLIVAGLVAVLGVTLTLATPTRRWLAGS